MVVMEPALLMALFLVICLIALNRNSGALATQGGNEVVVATLTKGFSWPNQRGSLL